MSSCTLYVRATTPPVTNNNNIVLVIAGPRAARRIIIVLRDYDMTAADDDEDDDKGIFLCELATLFANDDKRPVGQIDFFREHIIAELRDPPSST